MESNSAIFSSLVGIVPLNLGAMTIGDQGHHAPSDFCHPRNFTIKDVRAVMSAASAVIIVAQWLSRFDGCFCCRPMQISFEPQDA